MNDGSKLEDLVSIIEKMMLPIGFTVDTRQRRYNQRGTQIAELDILVSGTLGSKTINWLLECRDRPSEGPAPIAWIEQLYGRRNRSGLKIDMITAVSTTGFVQEVFELANQWNIELRTLSDITYQEVAQWLPFNAPLLVKHADFIDVKVFLEDQHIDLLVNSVRFNIVNVSEKLIIDTQTNEKVSLLDIWRRIINENDNLFEGIVPGKVPVQKKILVNCQKSKRYNFPTEQHTLSVVEIEYMANFRIIIPEMPIQEIKEYITSEKKIAQVARWKSLSTEFVDELIFIGIIDQNSN